MFRGIFPKLINPSKAPNIKEGTTRADSTNLIVEEPIGPNDIPSMLKDALQVWNKKYSFEKMEQICHDSSEISIDPFLSPLLKKSKSLGVISRRPNFLRLGQRLKRSKSVHFDKDEKIKGPSVEETNDNVVGLEKSLKVSSLDSTLEKENERAVKITPSNKTAFQLSPREVKQSNQSFSQRLSSLRLIPKDFLEPKRKNSLEEDTVQALKCMLVFFGGTDQGEEPPNESPLEGLRNLIESYQKQLKMQKLENDDLQSKLNLLELKASSLELQVRESNVKLTESFDQVCQLKKENSILALELKESKKQMYEITNQLNEDVGNASLNPEQSIRSLIQLKLDLQRQLLDFNESFNTEMVKLKNDVYTLESELEQSKKSLARILLKYECSKDFLEEDIEGGIEKFIIEASRWKIGMLEGSRRAEVAFRESYVDAHMKATNYEEKIKALGFELGLQIDRYKNLVEKTEQNIKQNNSLRGRIVELEKQNMELRTSSSDAVINLKVLIQLEDEHKKNTLKIENLMQNIIERQKANLSETETQLEFVANQNENCYSRLEEVERKNKVVVDENNNLKDLTRTYLGEVTNLNEKVRERNVRIKTLIKTNKMLVQAHSMLIAKCVGILRPFLTEDVFKQLNKDHEKMLSKEKFTEKDFAVFVRVIHLLTRGVEDLVNQISQDESKFSA